MKLYKKIRVEKTAFKVPALAAASHKFPIYTPKDSHFLTETGQKILKAQTRWHFRIVYEKKWSDEPGRGVEPSFRAGVQA